MSASNNQSLGEAIRDGLTEVAKRDPSVLFFAEGVQDPAGLFGTLKDLDKHLDPSRLIEMPIAENGLIGIAIGAAMAGKRRSRVHRLLNSSVRLLTQFAARVREWQPGEPLVSRYQVCRRQRCWFPG